MSTRHLISAPSNIALIKYMGKSDAAANLPENASLSMTLEDLASFVWIETQGQGSDVVLASGPLEIPAELGPLAAQARAPELSALGREKVLRHCKRVCEEAQRILPEHGLVCAGSRDLVLRTGNTFPEASGIASSASAFAALTLAVALASASDSAAFSRAWDTDIRLRRSLARVSRLGSGSSCRSFEGPFVLWEGEDARALPAPAMPALAHFVLLISSEAKAVSSSEAHARVKSSPLWAGRRERVANRLTLLRAALEKTGASDLGAIARLAWSEAWEMHSLFHTCENPFSYWKPGTIETLHWLAPYITAVSENVPPIVTLDAGPNVHVTVRASDAAVWRARFHERFGARAVLEDRPGKGAKIAVRGDVAAQGRGRQ